MAQDQVTAFNLALSAIGSHALISHVDEKSREAEICRLWYPTVKDTALRAAHWPCAKASALLTLINEREPNTVWNENNPEYPWVYRFNLPQDFLYPRHLADYVPFELSNYNGQPTLLTNTLMPILTYTKRDVSESSFDPDLWYAITQALAANIAMSLHGKGNRAQVAFANANTTINQARTNNANAAFIPQESLPDWLLERGCGLNAGPSQFIYSYGPLFVATS